MRVTLITEGTYPVASGDVSQWCDLLIRGLPRHSFDVVALGVTGREVPVWPEPTNVRYLVQRAIGVPLPARRRQRTGRVDVPAVQRELAVLWRCVLNPGSEAQVAGLRACLRRIVALQDVIDIRATLARRDSSAALIAAWNERADAGQLPAMTVADAVAVAAVVDRLLALTAFRIPETDVVHATANGPCGLLGVATKWRDGNPLVLTELGVYLREQYLALRRDEPNWVRRRVISTFTRAVSRVVLEEADAVLPGSEYDAAWARRLGADRSRLRVIPPGVDENRFPVLTDEPDEPVLAFLGELTPDHGVETLIRAHALMLDALPRTRLRIFGGEDASSEAGRALLAKARDLGTASLVSVHGPTNPGAALAAGSVIVVSPAATGVCYPLLCALMSGRASVAIDRGSARECVDAEQRVARVVQPDDERGLADACLPLLSQPVRRAHMGKLAAGWARERFSLRQLIEAYDRTYGSLAPPSEDRLSVGASS